MWFILLGKVSPRPNFPAEDKLRVDVVDPILCPICVLPCVWLERKLVLYVGKNENSILYVHNFLKRHASLVPRSHGLGTRLTSCKPVPLLISIDSSHNRTGIGLLTRPGHSCSERDETQTPHEGRASPQRQSFWSTGTNRWEAQMCMYILLLASS